MDLLRAEQRDIGTMYFLMNEDNVKLQFARSAVSTLVSAETGKAEISK